VVDAPAELPNAIAAAVRAAHVGATFLVDRARLARQRAARAVDAGRPSAARPGSAQARVAGQQAVAGERLALAAVGAALGGAVAPGAELEAHAEPEVARDRAALVVLRAGRAGSAAGHCGGRARRGGGRRRGVRTHAAATVASVAGVAVGVRLALLRAAPVDEAVAADRVHG